MLEEGDNLVWAINEAVTVIRSKAAGGFERGFALRNLIHLVGMRVREESERARRNRVATEEVEKGANSFIQVICISPSTV